MYSRKCRQQRAIWLVYLVDLWIPAREYMGAARWLIHLAGTARHPSMPSPPCHLQARSCSSSKCTALFPQKGHHLRSVAFSNWDHSALPGGDAAFAACRMCRPRRQSKILHVNSTCTVGLQLQRAFSAYSFGVLRSRPVFATSNYCQGQTCLKLAVARLAYAYSLLFYGLFHHWRVAHAVFFASCSRVRNRDHDPTKNQLFHGLLRRPDERKGGSQSNPQTVRTRDCTYVLS